MVQICRAFTTYLHYSNFNLFVMNLKLFILAIAGVSFASCSTAYKSGQTPDDVYFSPVRAVDERDHREEEKTTETRTDSYEEREIRMATRDRRWRDINEDYDYNSRYDPYRYGYNYGYYYNPYYYNRPVFLPGYTIINPKNSTPRSTNLGSYNNPTLVVANNKTGETKWVPANRSYNNSNNVGSFIRRVITPAATTNNNNRSNTNYENNNTRTYTPSSNSNNSGSSSSGSSGTPVSRPTRRN